MEDWKILVLSLREMAIEKGMSNNYLAEKLGKHQTSVGNFLLGDNPPTLENFMILTKLIGVKFTLEGQTDDIIAKAIDRDKRRRERKRREKRNKIIDEILNSDGSDISSDNNNANEKEQKDDK